MNETDGVAPAAKHFAAIQVCHVCVRPGFDGSRKMLCVEDQGIQQVGFRV